jgi:hypothetical protein
MPVGLMFELLGRGSDFLESVQRPAFENTHMRIRSRSAGCGKGCAVHATGSACNAFALAHADISRPKKGRPSGPSPLQ